LVNSQFCRAVFMNRPDAMVFGGIKETSFRSDAGIITRRFEAKAYRSLVSLTIHKPFLFSTGRE